MKQPVYTSAGSGFFTTRTTRNPKNGKIQKPETAQNPKSKSSGSQWVFQARVFGHFRDILIILITLFAIISHILFIPLLLVFLKC